MEVAACKARLLCKQEVLHFSRHTKSVYKHDNTNYN